MHGDGVMTRRASLSLGVAMALLGSATAASAQGLPPPPPGPPSSPSSPIAQPASPAVPDAQPPAPPPSPPASPPPSYQQPLVLLGPSRLPFNEGEPVPPGYEVQSRPSMGLARAGIATFVPLYGLSVLFGSVYLGSESGNAKRYGSMLIPVVGPFATIGTADTDGGTLFLVFDGLGQLTGATLFVIGMLSEEKYLARRTAGSTLRPEVFIGPKSATLRWQF